MRVFDRSADGAVEPSVVLSASPHPPRPPGGAGRRPDDLAGLLQQAQFAVVIAAVEGIRLLGSGVPAGTPRPGRRCSAV